MMKFYTELYRRDDAVEANSIARDRCLTSVPRIVQDEHNEHLTKDVTQEEI